MKRIGQTAVWLWTGWLMLWITALPARAQVTADQVRTSIERGVDYLKREQNPRNGTWVEHPIYEGGITSLCTLALLNSGVPLDDPAIQRALRFVRMPRKTRHTYSVALETMVLCAAEPDKDRLRIRENTAWLQEQQATKGPNKGGWSYGETLDLDTADPSNTQFAMLALHEAERVGVEVSDVVWQRALGYWTRLQRDDGAWAYPDQAPSGSMTCAGIASTIIALGQTGEGDAVVREGRVECCQPQADHQIPTRGLQWLAKHFTVNSNPYPTNPREREFNHPHLLYYIYGVERVGRMTGSRFIGEHDWYREGAEMLLKKQDRIAGYWRGTSAAKGVSVEEHPHVGTSLALLFLSKGRRPVVVSKLKLAESDDWNRHRQDIAHLTTDVERRWKRDLSWQVVDGQAASLEDLLQSPVLYLSGRDGLSLTPELKEKLKQYVEQGGFLFAESCCEGGDFDRDFRQLMAELFPDSPLRLLPPDHPIWYAEQAVPAEHLRPLYGVEACCRTSVVYCPGTLSCYWELASVRNLASLPEAIGQEVRSTLAMGANILTYATNRELKDKLDAPQVVPEVAKTELTERGTLYVAKIQHGGGSDDAPAALSNLLAVSRRQLQMRISAEKRLLPLTADSLYDYPILFLHGRRDFRFSEPEREALRRYVRNGGFVMADAICASEPFANAFRREMAAVFPENPLQPIAADHAMFTPRFQGFDVTTVRLRDPRPAESADGSREARVETIAPRWEGIEVEGRYAVVFSPYDLSCALENQTSISCRGYVREDAARMGMNMILYAMQR